MDGSAPTPSPLDSCLVWCTSKHARGAGATLRSWMTAEQGEFVAQLAIVHGDSSQHDHETSGKKPSRDVSERVAVCRITQSASTFFSRFTQRSLHFSPDLLHFHFFLAGDDISKLGVQQGCQPSSPHRKIPHSA